MGFSAEGSGFLDVLVHGQQTLSVSIGREIWYLPFDNLQKKTTAPIS
jgi:hypothetical protein